ncbi:TetR/AcrR family transcriptional regulator [Myxococcota bacterium]|nr:TetR/AcrR family transcriptional regulator [Myxococcota bacterium]
MDVREKILVEATRLIAANGFEGTSLQAVADAVGVKKPSVLHHFASKDELKRAVLDRLLARWNDVLPKLLRASALTGLAKFEAVTSEAFEFFAAEPDRARLILRELLDASGDIEAAADRYIRPWVEVVSSYVRLGQEAGQIRADVDPEAYVLEVAMMSLSTIATSDSMGTVLGANKKRPVTKRVVRELVRMAETSLFTPSYLEHQHAKSARERRGAE